MAMGNGGMAIENGQSMIGNRVAHIAIADAPGDGSFYNVLPGFWGNTACFSLARSLHCGGDVMTPQELRERTAEFAERIEAVTRPLLRNVETREAVLQLRDASSSVASNYRAAGRARSHAEFTAKIGTVLEEADESQFWLQHLNRCGLVKPDEAKPLLAEAGELVAIFTRATETAKKREDDQHLGPGRRAKRRRRR